MRYRALVTNRVTRVVFAGLFGRLPVGMSTLLFVLVVYAGTDSYAVAGYAAALCFSARGQAPATAS